MIAIATFLLVVVLSLLVTRIAATALTLTGLSWESARFQARSAFAGVGFTTREAESVVTHPVRRRIILLLMLLGNAGIVTAVSTLVLSFLDAGGMGTALPRLGLLLGGVGAFALLARSRWVDRRLTKAIAWALARWTALDARDYASLLHVCGGEYGVREILVEPGDWLVDRTLRDLALQEEGVLVLGVRRPDGSYHGAPSGRTLLRAADTLVVYGRASRLAELDRRREGPEAEWLHAQACAERRCASREPGGAIASAAAV
jgi:hypothetical protein